MRSCSVDYQTGQAICAVEPTADPEKVAAGLAGTQYSATVKEVRDGAEGE